MQGAVCGTQTGAALCDVAAERHRAAALDCAYAYVVAHEVGHHVQDLLGILDKVDAAKQRVSQIQANALSVRVELQADCLRRRLGRQRQPEMADSR